jgi:hypothetical protein
MMERLAHQSAIANEQHTKKFICHNVTWALVEPFATNARDKSRMDLRPSVDGADWGKTRFSHNHVSSSCARPGLDNGK